MTASRFSDPPPFDRRIRAVRGAVAALGLDVLYVTHPPNLRYLVGFDGSIGALLVTAESCTLIVDGRYVTAMRTRLESTPSLAGVDLVHAERSHEESAAAVMKERRCARTIGVEAASLTLARAGRLETALARELGSGTIRSELRPTERIVERERMVKDATEIATLRAAGAMLSGVARGVTDFVRPGRSERAIASDIDASIRQAGFEKPAFETIVASGLNSALPHARPGGRVLEAGDGVVLDFGGVYDGYCVDLTRTVQLEPSSSSFSDLFEAVRAAHDAAIRAVEAGILASAVDAAARHVLIERGLGQAFVHGTGHGLGLEVHEEPRLSKTGSAQHDEVLVPGMVFTIEPGAYVPGLGGVRLEDDVLVVAEGCDVLTDVPIERLKQ